MPGFKIDKILHGHQVQVPKARKNYETKVFVTQRFRPKKYKTEVIVFPAVNSFMSQLSDLKIYVSYVYITNGLAKGDVIIDQSYFIQGEAKRKYHQTMQLQQDKEIPLLGIDRNNNELPKQITIPPPHATFESRISLKPKLRAKTYRVEVYIYPKWNNTEHRWACDLSLFVCGVRFKKGLAKENIIIQETVLTPGEVKKKFKKDISMTATASRVR